MGLFNKKKRIDVIIFWKSKIDYLFSDEFEEAFQLLLSTKSELLQKASKAELKKHIIAAYIELLNISLAKNHVNRERRYEILTIRDDYIRSKNGEGLLNFIDNYNREFGSSISDGVRPMAVYFSNSIETANKKELEKFIYKLFYAVLNESFTEIRNLRLV
jgi:hypothetical protein